MFINKIKALGFTQRAGGAASGGLLACASAMALLALTAPSLPVFAASSSAASSIDGAKPLTLPNKSISPALGQFHFGDTLIDAADLGKLSAVKSLIQSGKFVDSRGKFEVTALMRAAYRGHKDVVQYLLSIGADANLADVGGATAMHMAARAGHAEVVQLLLSANANPNLADMDGWTPLMRAAIHNHRPTVEVLLAGGADPDSSNMMGETPLMMAAFAGNASLASLLIERGASRDVTDANGLTAADIAFQRGFEEVTQALVETTTYAQLPPENIMVEPVGTSHSSQPLRPFSTQENELAGIFDDSRPVGTSAPASPVAPSSAAPSHLMIQPPQQSTPIADEAPPWEIVSPQTSDGWQAGRSDGLTNKRPAKEESASASTEDRRTVGSKTSEIGLYEAGNRRIHVDDEGIPPLRLGSDMAKPRVEEPIYQPQQDVLPMKHAPVEGMVYMLQLGSSDSATGAARQWNRLQREHSDILQGMNPVMSKVTLRGSGREVYRTQVGYFSDREAAGRVCDALSAKGAECFVVEAAAADAPPEMQKQVLPKDQPLQLPPSGKGLKTPLLQDTPERPLDNQSILRLQEDKQRFHQEAEAFKEESAALRSLPPEAFGDEALDPPPSPTPPEPTFMMQPPEPKRKEPKHIEAVQQPVKDDRPEMIRLTPKRDVLEDNIGEPSPATFDNVPEVPQPHSAQMPAQEKIISLRDEEPATLPTSLATPATTVAPSAPAVTANSRPVDLTMLPPESSFSADVIETDPHLAQPIDDHSTGFIVAEAVRVPLTDLENAPIDQPVQVPVSKRPSMSEKRQSDWVSFGAFDNEADARAFWNKIISEKPGIVSGLRFRVISPLKAPRTEQRVWAEVGPVERESHRDRLCEFAKKKRLECRTRRDIGISTAAMPAPQGQRRAAMDDRFAPVDYDQIASAPPVVVIPPASNAEPASYWVQLGSFNHLAQAQAHWGAVYQHAASELEQMTPYAMPPAHSSSEHPIYRLRLGPYGDKNEAYDLCAELRFRGVRCLTIYGQ